MTILRYLSLFCCGWVFVCGCANNTPVKGDVSAIKSKTLEQVSEYLRSQQLPAAESIGRWENEFGQGLQITTRHYQIYTTLLEPLMLRQLPGFMESAYRGYNRQVPEPIEIHGRFKVYLFAERSQWDDFTDATAGKTSSVYKRITAGAYCLNGSVVAYNIGRERTFSVLGHEGFHQFNSRCFKFRLPSWLDEGVAMLFEASRCEDGMFYFEPDRNAGRLGSLKKTLLEDEIIPLERLIGLNPGELLANDDKTAVRAFYCQSYALVRFLREENYGQRLKDYQRMLLGGLEGSWPLSKKDQRIAADRNIAITAGWNRIAGKKLFRYYIGENLQQIQKQYLRFCRKITYHVHLK